MLSPKRGRDLGTFGSAEALTGYEPCAGAECWARLGQPGRLSLRKLDGRVARPHTCLFTTNHCRVVDWGGSSRAPIW